MVLGPPLQRSWNDCNRLGKMTANTVVTLILSSQNTLLKPHLSSVTVALSSERSPGLTREYTHAHVRWLCPCVHAGAGPRLAARCPPGGGLYTDLYRASQWRPARPAATPCRPGLYAPRRYPRGLEARPSRAVAAPTARHGRGPAQSPDGPTLPHGSPRHEHPRRDPGLSSLRGARRM